MGIEAGAGLAEKEERGEKEELLIPDFLRRRDFSEPDLGGRKEAQEGRKKEAGISAQKQR